MNNLAILITLLLLSGCANSNWTVDARIAKWGDDTCHVKKSKIKACHRFNWPNGKKRT